MEQKTTEQCSLNINEESIKEFEKNKVWDLFYDTYKKLTQLKRKIKNRHS